jgi:hypothetical protein
VVKDAYRVGHGKIVDDTSSADRDVEEDQRLQVLDKQHTPFAIFGILHAEQRQSSQEPEKNPLKKPKSILGS